MAAELLLHPAADFEGCRGGAGARGREVGLGRHISAGRDRSCKSEFHESRDGAGLVCEHFSESAAAGTRVSGQSGQLSCVQLLDVGEAARRVLFLGGSGAQGREPGVQRCEWRYRVVAEPVARDRGAVRCNGPCDDVSRRRADGPCFEEGAALSRLRGGTYGVAHKAADRGVCGEDWFERPL